MLHTKFIIYKYFINIVKYNYSNKNYITIVLHLLTLVRFNKIINNFNDINK